MRANRMPPSFALWVVDPLYRDQYIARRATRRDQVICYVDASYSRALSGRLGWVACQSCHMNGGRSAGICRSCQSATGTTLPYGPRALTRFDRSSTMRQ